MRAPNCSCAAADAHQGLLTGVMGVRTSYGEPNISSSEAYSVEMGITNENFLNEREEDSTCRWSRRQLLWMN